MNRDITASLYQIMPFFALATLSSILRAVAQHKGVDRDALLESFR